MTHFIAAGSNKPREKNLWHSTKRVRGSHLQNHRSILNNKHYGITKSASMRDIKLQREASIPAVFELLRFLSESRNLCLCVWSQQEEFHTQFSHRVEFMLIKIFSIYPIMCTRVKSCIHNSKSYVWIWAPYAWQRDIICVMFMNFLHKSADVNPSKFTRGFIITSGINFRYLYHHLQRPPVFSERRKSNFSEFVETEVNK